MRSKKKIWLTVVVALLAAAPLIAGGGREAPPDAETEPAVVDGWRGTGSVQIYADPAAYTEATGETIPGFSEAPSLRARVEAGELPPVEERLPKNPMVVAPADRIGVYGGQIRENHQGRWDKMRDIVPEPLMIANVQLSELYPNIVQSWEFEDGGRIIVFRLREGLKWSDGHPVTADDFVFWSEHFAWNEDLNPAGVRELRIGGEMGYYEKIDDYTFRAVFPLPYASYVERMTDRANSILPKHYMSQFHPAFTSTSELNAVIRAEGYSSWVDMFMTKMELHLDPVNYDNPDVPTLSAWMKVSGGVDEPVERWVRNPYYWKVDIAGNQLPYIDEIVRYNVGESEEAVLLRALAGESDWDYAEYLGGIDNFSTLRQRESSGNYRLVPDLPGARDGLARPAVFLNLDHPEREFRELFQNRDFRYALSLAIDNSRLNDLFLEGTQSLTQGYAPPAGPPYFGERDIFKKGMNFDVEEANRILDSLGLEWNASRTRRRTSGGKELQFTHIIRPRDPFFVPIAEAMQETWRQIGVDTTIRPVSGSLWNEQVETNSHDIAMDRWWFGSGVYGFVPTFRDLAPRDDGWKASPSWGLWAITGGDLGTEPPNTVKRLVELQAEALASRTRQERIEIETQMFEIHAEEMWFFAPAGQRIASLQTNYFYIHNRLKNVTVPTPYYPYYAIPASWFIEE